jgi:hypothetical protein
MKILSLEKQTPFRFCLWIEDGDQYRKVIVQDGESIEELQAVPVVSYKGYEHFVGVMGKFNPWTIFTDKPVEVPDLKIGRVKKLAVKFNQDRRE